ACVKELLGEVRVAGGAAGTVRDPLELLDRAAVARDRVLEAAALQLHHPEVEEAATDLLDAAVALGRLESSLVLRHRIGEAAEPASSQSGRTSPPRSESLANASSTTESASQYSPRLR